ncbi:MULTISPECIES: TetR/AcrR family transcriptional regulator [Bacillota]|jgi:AcrR family transcriptional regulator|uniref:TetR family transcriptional regulator n=5 Tax=Bacillota TaxID=1239 RepID=A0A3N9URJ1_9BACI|nr:MULTISPECIES: TetR/AcrR family transcriptional regulator [Bacillota]HCJ4334379.1 TetR/AcrR family transcriptional regulator [Listeria innocua]ACL77149.1 transcriptional regulator, TetR family [Ruminiclostridium cellulolyticum H10]MBK4210374.1 TetR family transcriptional regulator [Bacillus licheniformis]MBM7608065.1 AcrR family transcriptional regulator [Lysinibacillus composti]MBU8564313.1 TetR family transcriptional regulator [Bacillus licheniformis]
MPKIVDHDEKRKQIAEAAWNIIRKEGVEKASIRRVAAEAGMSSGALRHYFSTQDEMLLFIMNYYLEEGKKRSQNKEWSENPVQAVEEVLLELVPIDEEKKIETSVWWILALRSLTSDTIKDKKDEMTDGTYELANSMIEILALKGVLSDSMNAELEKSRLTALIEGLSIHALLRPDVYSPEKVKEVIRYHLETLCNKIN